MNCEALIPAIPIPVDNALGALVDLPVFFMGTR
jgi:hypothetical protein